MNERTILCVEDNERVQTFNRQLLEAQGYAVRTAMTLAEAWRELERSSPDLVILDLNMPDGDGLSFLRQLRGASEIPVLLLTGYGEDRDIVAGFQSGCDDYLPKPYSFPVLLARAENLLRRARCAADMVTKGPLLLDRISGRALISGEDLLLKPKEFALLLLLVQNEGVTIPAGQLYQRVWNAPLGGDKRALQKHLSLLRGKLEAGRCGYTIHAVYGTGYRFMKK